MKTTKTVAIMTRQLILSVVFMLSALVKLSLSHRAQCFASSYSRVHGAYHAYQLISVHYKVYGAPSPNQMLHYTAYQTPFNVSSNAANVAIKLIL